MSPALAVQGLTVAYGARRVLCDVSFDVGPGELVAVIGPNGAGKSSLFRAACGLVPHTGDVNIGGAHCHHHRSRLDLAYIPQRADLDLDFPITVGQLVLAGRRRFVGLGRRAGLRHREAAAASLDRVGLAGLDRRSLGTLSGGQAQRAMLARALAQEATVVLLDESLSGIDAPAVESLVGLFGDLCRDGTTMLVASHDLSLVRRRFARCLALNGRLVADGTPTTVLDADALVATFGAPRALPVAS